MICKGNTYIQAVQKMQRALYEFHIRGIKTNIIFLNNVMRDPEFLSGQATTSFIDRNPHLFHAQGSGTPESSKLLDYLSEMVRIHVSMSVTAGLGM